MKRIAGWLKEYLPRFKSLDLPDASRESATDAPTRKMHTDEYVNTVPNLKILDESPPATDESTGFNPYDTGTLQIK